MQYPSSSLPAYQPKYTLSSREGQDKHALFFNNGSSGAAPPPPSSSSSWGGTSGSQRYPQVADARLPPPALLDQAQMQQLQLGPSAGPTLGPQEIEVGQGLRSGAVKTRGGPPHPFKRRVRPGLSDPGRS